LVEQTRPYSETEKTDHEQRREHDEELARCVVDLIGREDIANGLLSACFHGGRALQRILGALDLARQHERALKAPAIAASDGKGH
jgi:hypothetical protein